MFYTFTVTPQICMYERCLYHSFSVKGLNDCISLSAIIVMLSTFMQTTGLWARTISASIIHLIF